MNRDAPYSHASAASRDAEPDSAPISRCSHPGGDVGRTDKTIRTIVSITQTKSAPLIHHFHLSCMIDFLSSDEKDTFPSPSPDGHVVSEHGKALSPACFSLRTFAPL